jgi:(p)ppGpp synthase/HD superfamily hydrolase
LPHIHDIVQRAQKYSEVIHQGQLRDGGQSYAAHPAAVALSLYEHGVRDPDTLAAAYLHDALEDLPGCEWALRRALGQTVTAIVKELTIPPEFDTNFEQKHAYLARHAKTLTPQAKLIKLADRAHNILELPQKSPDKRPRYARATADLLEALKPWPIEPLARQIQEHIKPYL